MVYPSGFLIQVVRICHDCDCLSVHSVVQLIIANCLRSQRQLPCGNTNTQVCCWLTADHAVIAGTAQHGTGHVVNARSCATIICVWLASCETLPAMQMLLRQTKLTRKPLPAISSSMQTAVQSSCLLQYNGHTLPEQTCYFHCLTTQMQAMTTT